MLKDIEEVLLRKGKVASVIFVYDEHKYTAKMSEDKMILSRDDSSRGNLLVVEHEMKTGKTSWHVEHCCGASGFGLGIDDVCYACSTPGQKMEATPENRTKIIVYGKYSPELAKIPGEVLEYCKQVEEQLKDFEKSFFSPNNFIK